jgi:hypothetical protein
MVANVTKVLAVSKQTMHRFQCQEIEQGRGQRAVSCSNLKSYGKLIERTSKFHPRRIGYYDVKNHKSFFNEDLLLLLRIIR